MGKTFPVIDTSSGTKKHPHERGEDQHQRRCKYLRAETPPRAWGRLTDPVNGKRPLRNTPTSVGKTHTIDVLGEGVGETPPRAWGRQYPESESPARRGNTPTSVGKTSLAARIFKLEEKHPHERGEDVDYVITSVPRAETPPRAWGRPPCYDIKARHARNTPTSVGKTSPEQREIIRS